MERNDLIERLRDFGDFGNGSTNDAMNLCNEAATTIATLSEALAEAEAEKKGAEAERLADFARGIIRDSAWQGCDLDGAEVQERALKAGLLRSEKFDPAVHEDVEGYTEPGMDWFVFSGPLAPLRDLSQGGQP